MMLEGLIVLCVETGEAGRVGILDDALCVTAPAALRELDASNVTPRSNLKSVMSS